MTTPERFPKVPQPEGGEQFPSPTQQQSVAVSPSRRRKQTRFEIGFFIRKIVDGKLEYLLRLLPGKVQRLRTGTRSTEAAETEELEQPVHARAVPVSGEGVTEQAGTGKDNDDGGPIHETRVELGAFAGKTTETSSTTTDGPGGRDTDGA